LRKFSENYPGILSYFAAEYSAKEGLNKGFTHHFEMKFTTEAERDKYQVDPEHTKIKEKVKPLLADIFAFDYVQKDLTLKYYKKEDTTAQLL